MHSFAGVTRRSVHRDVLPLIHYNWELRMHHRRLPVVLWQLQGLLQAEGTDSLGALDAVVGYSIDLERSQHGMIAQWGCALSAPYGPRSLSIRLRALDELAAPLGVLGGNEKKPRGRN